MVPKRAFLLGAVASAAVALGACTPGSPSVSPTTPLVTATPLAADVCADAAAVRTAVTDLKELDVIAVGKDGLTASIAAVEAAVTQLATSASDVAVPEVEALRTAVANGKAVVDSLSGDASIADKQPTSGQLLPISREAATALRTTLTQCASP